ncbi:glug [Treponema primitia ZAS-2]|uniref:Glug n=1 Tax=Treponema primitia (strain ATCC BAA-887 / DSM 12427 / ZAS-2) TaxID=545694 RepID=F5YIM9_TREPZ|nr:GLUG motif-containing protein [Treponema primitia]AEF86450.1 glug [Treponema primitia ZAS-2]
MMNGKADKNGAWHQNGDSHLFWAKGAWHLLGFVMALLMAGCAATVGGPEGGPVGGGLGGPAGTVRVEVSGLGLGTELGTEPETALGTEPEPVSGVSATPKLQAVPQGPQRTAYPTPPPVGGLDYTYTWKKSGTEMDPQPEEVSAGNYILAVGAYTLYVEAYDDSVPDNKLVGTGTEDITVANGQSQTVTVTLKPVTGAGAGTLAYTITYPAGTTVLSLTLQNLADEGGEPIVLTPTTTPPTTLTGTKAGLAAGDYLLRAELLNSAGYAGMSETVHIYGNMTTYVGGPSTDPTAASFEFTAKDFAAGDPALIGEYTGTFTVEKSVDGRLIKSITPTDITDPILIGRRADEQVFLNIDSEGNLQFRDPDAAGFVPIGSYAEFQLINTQLGPDHSDDKYKQEADLDLLGGAPGVWGGEQWDAVGFDYDNSFTGTFDGGGKAIRNLYINKSSSVQGLFGWVGEGGTVQNVRIASGSVTSDLFVGGVAGYNEGIITDCSNSGTVTSESYYAGGVVGNNNYGSITACYNTGSVSGNGYAGGVVGSNSGPITACYNIGPVSGNSQVGGVVGSNSGPITACYNTGPVYGTTYAGGVVGESHGSTITACYNTGPVSGNGYVGGVVGESHGSTITACYWKDVGGAASAGVGGDLGDSGTTKFGGSSWPTNNATNSWGIGNDPDTGFYWKSLGNSATPVYPTLYWQE